MLDRNLTRRDLLRGAAAASLAAAAAHLVPPSAHAAAGDVQTLFNGKDLTGWDGDPRFWSVQDGAITGITTKEKPTPGNTFIIWRGGTLGSKKSTLVRTIASKRVARSDSLTDRCCH